MAKESGDQCMCNHDAQDSMRGACMHACMHVGVHLLHHAHADRTNETHHVGCMRGHQPEPSCSHHLLQCHTVDWNIGLIGWRPKKGFAGCQTAILVHEWNSFTVRFPVWQFAGRCVWLVVDC